MVKRRVLIRYLQARAVLCCIAVATDGSFRRERQWRVTAMLMGESQRFTGIERRQEQRSSWWNRMVTRQNKERETRWLTWSRWLASSTIAVGLRGKEKASASSLDPSGWRVARTREIHMLPMFQPLFLSTRCPCASNDINSMIGTSMHVIYAAIGTRVCGWTASRACSCEEAHPKPRLNPTHALPSLSPFGL
jgi:hypothetical protein